MSVIGIDHVQVAAPAACEEVARFFYGRLLGMEELAKPVPLASRGGCWFAAGSQQLHVGVVEPFVPALKAHPGLLVSDLAAVRRRLRRAGLRYQDDASPEGHDRLYVEDPFGNRIELRAARGTQAPPEQAAT